MLTLSLCLLWALYLLRYGQKTASKFQSMYGKIKKPTFIAPRLLKQEVEENWYSTACTVVCSSVYSVGSYARCWSSV